MRALRLVFVLAAIGCGSQASTGSGGSGGNGGTGGGGGGTGGAISCFTAGASLDCAHDCSNLAAICTNPSTKQCLGLCVQGQSYCAQLCKLASTNSDFAVFGCLQQTDGDCASFSTCLDQCDGRSSNPGPTLIDMARHD